MRLSYRSLLLTVLVASPLGMSGAAGQSIPSPYRFLERAQEVGPFAGSVSAATGRFGFGPSGGALFGVSYGVHLAGPVSLEGVIGTIQSERDIINPGRDEGDRIVGTTDALLSSVDARLRFSLVGHRAWHGINPHLIFGGGMVWDAKSSPVEAEESLDAADQFSFGRGFLGTLGTGMYWYLRDGIALRVDGQFTLWKLATPPGFSDPARDFEAVESSEWVRGLGLTISGIFRW